MLIPLLFAAALGAPPQYFIGTWRCEITSPHGTRVWISTTTIDLDGLWLHEHVTGPSRVPGRRFVGETYIGYNASSKRFAKVTVNSFGGYWISESPGWRGDLWSWTDVTSEDGEWGVVDIKRLSARHYRSVEKVRHANGSFSVESTMDCVKAK